MIIHFEYQEKKITFINDVQDFEKRGLEFRSVITGATFFKL